MRGVGNEGIALIGGRLGQPAGIERAIDRFQNFGARIERAQSCGKRGAGAFAGNVGLGDDQTVGEDRLLARLGRPGQRVEAVLGVHHRHHRLDMEDAAERPVGREGLQDGRGIREPAGFDHDATEVGQFAALALDHHAAQRLLQVACA